MTSSPIDKIMEALASSSSTNYVEENILALLDRKQEVMDVLEQLVEDRKIFCCKITKAGRSFTAYWLPFHVAPSKRKQHSALFISGEKMNRVHKSNRGNDHKTSKVTDESRGKGIA